MIHKLLLLPFLIVPFLISSKFYDLTFNIKNISTFFLLTSVLILFYLKNIPKYKVHINIYIYLLFYLLYLIVSSIFISTNNYESFWSIFYLFSWFIVYITFIQYIDDTIVKYIIFITVGVGTLLSLLVYNDVYQFMNLSIPSYGKLSATFGYKNYFSQYLCFSIPACIVSIFIINKIKFKLFIYVCMFINVGALIFIRSRASWFSIVICLIIFILINKKNIIIHFKELFKHKIVILFFTIVFFLLSYLITTPINIESGIWIGDKSSFNNTLFSITKINDLSFWGKRSDMFSSSISMIKDNPLFGVGKGNWKILYPGYSENETYTDFSQKKIILHPHNELLLIICETGLIGLILLLIFIFYHFRLLERYLRRLKNHDKYYLMMFCILAFVSISVESFFDFPYQRILPNLYFWAIFGYIYKSDKETIEVNTSKKNVLPFLMIIITTIIFIDIKSQYHIQNQYNNRKTINTDKMKNIRTRNIDYLAQPIAYHIGNRYNSNNEEDNALKYYNIALKLSPYHYETLVSKMFILFNKNKFEEGFNLLLYIRKYYPKSNKPILKIVKYCIKYDQMMYANKILDILENDIDEKMVNYLRSLIY